MRFHFPLKAVALFSLMACAALMAFPPGLWAQAVAMPPAAAKPAAPPSAPAPVSSGGDILKVNDLVRVTVYKEDDMLTEARVSKSGNITLPLIGPVHVEGKSVAEAVAEIKSRLDKDYIINPQVTVTVMEYSPQWVTVLGEVQRPSQVPMPPDGGLDIMAAIALAGGYTRVADPSKIVVRRVVNKRDVVLKIDAKKLAADSRSSAFMVQPGDTISVGQSVW